MAPNSLVAIVDIKRGQMFELNDVLREVHNPYKDDNPYLRIGRTAHFVRFLFLPGKDEDDVIYPGEDQDRGAVEDRTHRLAFWAVFDGDTNDFIDDVVALSPNLDAIFDRCEGYTSGNLRAFLTSDKHRFDEQVFYSTFPDDSVATIREKHDLRKKVEAILDDNPDKETALREIVNLNPVNVQDNAKLRKNLFFGGLVALIIGGLIVFNIFFVVLLVVVLGALYWLLNEPWKEVNAAFSGQTGAYEDQVHGLDDAQLIAMSVNRVEPLRLYSREHQIAQNQFNLYLTFKKDIHWIRVLRMRAVMFVINTLGKYVLDPGSLGGLSTVHFGVWVLIDDNRRLLFMTCYDGTWENYIADFVNHIHPMLDVELMNFVGFSPYGTRDIAAFRRWLRRVQIQSDVFYSGYPGLTVRNINRDIHINKTLPTRLSKKSDKWLELL